MNVRFQPYVGKRFKGWIHKDFQPPVELLEYPEKVCEFPGAERLLDCRGRQIFRLPLLVRGQFQSCFTYYFRNASLSRSLRRNYAFQNLRMSRKLHRNGLGTITVVAALKQRGEWLNWHSFSVAPEIPSVCEIPSTGNHIFQVHPVIDFSPQIAVDLARELVSFHTKGFFHGDLKTRHILVDIRQNPHTRFYFVDLEKCQHFPHLKGYLRDILAARDLVQLFASLPETSKVANFKGVLLDHYLGASELSLSRQERLRRIIDLYRPGGVLRQGQTLFSSLWTNVVSPPRD